MAPKRPVFSLEASLKEAEAFERLVAAQRNCIEACTEIAIYRSESSWIKVAQFYESLLAKTQIMQSKSVRVIHKKAH